MPVLIKSVSVTSAVTGVRCVISTNIIDDILHDDINGSDAGILMSGTPLAVVSISLSQASVTYIKYHICNEKGVLTI